MNYNKKALLFYFTKNVTLSILCVIVYFYALVCLDDPSWVTFFPWLIYILFLDFGHGKVIPIISYIFIILNVCFIYRIFVKKNEYKIEDIPKYFPKVSYITLSLIILMHILIYDKFVYLGEYDAHKYSVEATSYLYYSSGTLILNIFIYIILLLKNKVKDMYNNVSFLILNILNILFLNNAYSSLSNYIQLFGITEKRSQGMIIIYLDFFIISVFILLIVITLFRKIVTSGTGVMTH